MTTHVAECLLDLALVVDCSSSIGLDNWQLVIDFMVNIVSSVNVGKKGTRVGAVTFGMLLQC